MADEPHPPLPASSRPRLPDRSPRRTDPQNAGTLFALFGLGLLAFDPEPLDPKSPLWDVPGVYISAHSSVSVDRYMEDVFDLFVDNLERYVAGTPLRNVVDMESLGFS